MEKSDFRETVFAFNKSDVVASYDLDMDIWHPNRVKMASLLCELLPFNKNANLRMVDLGVGTGYVSYRILETFPNATIIAIDAAELMIEKAKLRLKDYLKQITFKNLTFQSLLEAGETISDIDLVVSTFALHHLYREEKLKLFKYIYSILRPHGWFVNGDVFRTDNAVIEARYRYLHHLGIQQRTKAIKNQEKSQDQISSEYLEKETKDGDHPLLLNDDLQLLSEAGFCAVECFWKEYREAVYGGIK